MADNTQLNTGTGGDIISTDAITTLNGGAIVTGEKAQRVKVGWGADAVFNDTNATNPLPVTTTPTTDVTPATQTITARDIVSATATGANSQSITTGTPTAGSAATFTLSSWETILVQVTGTWTGTITSEGSFDGGTTWASKAVKQIGTAYTANSLTGNFNGAINTSGLTHIRFRGTAAWTGTATVLIRQSTNIHSTYVANNLTLKDGTTQSISNTIKAASTAANATDTSLVVALSPNSAGANMQLSGTAVKDDTQFGDGVTTGIVASTNRLYNGASYDRQRSIGTGVALTALSDGTNTTNVLKSDGTAAGQNAALVGGTYLTSTFTTTIPAATTATDVGNYRWVSVHIVTQGTSSVVNFQGSNDNTNWVAASLQSIGNANSSATGSTSSAGTIYYGPLSFRYFRLNITAISAGTTAGSIMFSTLPGAFQTIGVNATLAAGVAAIGSVTTTAQTPGVAAANLGKAEDAAHASGDTGVAVWGVRNDTLASTTSASGDYSQISTDTAGVVITAGAPRLLKGRQVTTLTASTTETTIVTAIAATFCDIYGLVLANTSATATEVIIRDATAGGTATPFMVPPNDTRGFMLPLDSAVPQATANNNWTATCGTSVTSLKVTVLYVKRV